jgi:hypothetical protein
MANEIKYAYCQIMESILALRRTAQRLASTDEHAPTYELALEQWKIMGRALNLEGDEAAAQDERRQMMGPQPLIGCSFTKCPLFRVESRITHRTMLRCVQCKSVSGRSIILFGLPHTTLVLRSNIVVRLVNDGETYLSSMKVID